VSKKVNSRGNLGQLSHDRVEAAKMENLCSVADEYFRSLNPIAKRICDDVKSTRENYESAWNYLGPQEQSQVINESLIYPAATLKYSLKENEKERDVRDYIFPPHSKQSGGRKILEDESGVQWKDEHSAPFLWKTFSQLDINVSPKATTKIDKIKACNNQVTDSSNSSTENIQKFPDYPDTFQADTTSTESTETAKSTEPAESNHSVTAEDTPDIRTDEDESSNSQIPKTGCAFLDNW